MPACVRRVLRAGQGCCDCSDLLSQSVDWDKTATADFHDRWHRPATPLSSGAWGRHCRIFFDRFYGESFEVAPGASWTRPGSAAPFGCIVWTGVGRVNGCAIDAVDKAAREFLVTPGVEMTLDNTGAGPLMVFSVFPLDFTP